MPEYDFSGQVAFVTGAARGQGRSHAVGFAEHGADVVAVDVGKNDPAVPYDLGTGAELDETVDRIEERGQRGLAIRADVSQADEVEAAVDRALDEFGRIDVLANNAGVTIFTEAMQLDEAVWERTLNTNLKGAWLCAKHVGQHMIDRGEGGRIVSTSSNAGLVGAPFLAHYSASKHGIVGLTKTLALELAEHDITVNAVCPTAVTTPLIDEAMEVWGPEPMEEMARFAGPSNLLEDDAEMIPPQAVTEAYLWLASDAARYVTGVALPVDAGFTAK